MFNSNSSDSDLLKSLLEPLLEDFQHWFKRSQLLLENEDISFLDAQQQAYLLSRVVNAQNEVRAAQLLMDVTNCQVGVETSLLAVWHNLVTECWQVTMRFRLQQSTEQGT
jgi:hypothetical protein